jgi:hypothetical protein
VRIASFVRETVWEGKIVPRMREFTDTFTEIVAITSSDPTARLVCCRLGFLQGLGLTRATACFLYNYVCGKLQCNIRVPYSPHIRSQRTVLGRLGHNHRS